MKSKFSALNIAIVVIGLIVLAYGLTQKSESTVFVNEVGEAVTEANAELIDDANEGKLVIVSGQIAATSTLKDEFFDISMSTVKLKRVVEMYQWAQNCENDCVYYQTWSENVIDSKNFDDAHQNPDTKQYESKEYFEENVHLGAYTLPEKLVNDLYYDTVMGPDEISGVYAGRYNLIGEYITNSENPETPAVGDFRISYKYVKDKDVTVVAKQSEGSFAPYYTENKKEIYEISDGIKTTDEYIASMERGYSVLGVVLAIVGAVFLAFGIGAIIFDVLKNRKNSK